MVFSIKIVLINIILIWNVSVTGYVTLRHVRLNLIARYGHRVERTVFDFCHDKMGFFGDMLTAKVQISHQSCTVWRGPLLNINCYILHYHTFTRETIFFLNMGYCHGFRTPKFPTKRHIANNVDPDQTAPERRNSLIRFYTVGQPTEYFQKQLHEKQYLCQTDVE